MPELEPSLTVVVPAYNEAPCLPIAAAEIRQEVLDRVPGSELLVVDDGSTDETPRILTDLAVRDDRIRSLRQANAGHGAALRTGLEQARGEWIFLLDSDAEISLEAFSEHWGEATRDGTAVLGVRTGRSDPWSRRVLTRAIRLVNRLLFATRVEDANVPYKLLPTAYWERARRFIPPGTLAPSLFLALFLDRADAPFVQRPVTHRDRAGGVSSLRSGRLLRFCSRAFGQLLGFRWRLFRWKPDRGS